MNLTTQELFHWIISHGYVLMFLVMFLEGPIATLLAALASAMGYFNLSIVFILAILGDVIPDSLYYLTGYLSNKKFINKIIKKFKISNAGIEKTKQLILENNIKAIITIKMTPILPFFGFMMLGIMRISFKQILVATMVITGIRSIILIMIGFYFGQYIEIINKYMGYTWSIIGIIMLVLIISLVNKKLGQSFLKKK